ncbi:DNA-binding transcriptional regulator, XRE-family HTH domain [Methylomagnum ishizawai]|uniref:DNA-binding transcriptional regulator, XRE-family HTH domain n=1 Tax=Methylomagnum ishizawai TaxID=1760988 RepID=A0A1Y6D6J1_9GAMM|nr:helix-turn-helix domain-containing protein [Methylomagnum ishizawai]SMF96152.1 DNA-binding transcriptional regulator, XRE-family HTH domain [Methylomagnum ishizawai]
MSTEITSGQRIAEWRKTKKLSQQKLADLIGVSRSYLGDVEAGRCDASAKILTSMAKHTDVNPGWLLTGEGVMEREPPISEPVSEDPLAQQKAQVKALVDRLDDPRKLSAVQDSIEESERMKRVEKELAELRGRTG